MKCLDDGTLQAYLDLELPAAEQDRAAGHLEGCAGCRARLSRLEATLARVRACLEALAPEDLRVTGDAVPRFAARPARMRWQWAAVALAGALTASLALIFGSATPRPEPAPVAKTLPAPPIQLAPAPPEPAPVRSVPARARRPKPRRALDDFVVLDNADPMQMGMVVRVMLPVSGASVPGGMQVVAADLMIGEDGRARAIRFVR